MPGPQLDRVCSLPYMNGVRKYILMTPLFALLAVALWFAGAAWMQFTGDIPLYGWVAIAGGVIFSLLVGGGLMALVFYSNRHGYDDLSGGDGADGR
jgi:hypothetical protein